MRIPGFVDSAIVFKQSVLINLFLKAPLATITNLSSFSEDWFSVPSIRLLNGRVCFEDSRIF